MASPSSVLTQGLGAWGSVSLVITLGFGSGAAADNIPSIDYTEFDSRPEYTSRSKRPEFTLTSQRPEFTARKT